VRFVFFGFVKLESVVMTTFS